MTAVIEFSADATGVGKSLAALRTRYYFDARDVPNVLVSIETRGVEAYRKRRRGDLFIATEDFKRAQELPGGLVGVLRPLFDAIERAAKANAVVIIDWPGGQAQNRLQVLAATGFDQRLAELQVAGLSVVVTTCLSDRMRQAAANLVKTHEVAPSLQRALLLNERGGAFKFAAGSAPAAAYRELQRAAAGVPVVRFPAIEAESWQECEAAGFSLPGLIRATPAAIAERTRLDRFSAAACSAEVAAWWTLTEQSLTPVLPFRAQ
jgi:hypothetical protein